MPKIRSSGLLALQDVACERDERHLYTGVTVAFGRGELWHIKGANGVGKTSLLRQMAGLLPIDQGHITYHAAVKILYIGHQLALKDSLTAVENLAWLTALNHPTTPYQRSQALAKAGLAGYENHLVGDLSAGQKRRVALARLHCQQADVWLLDEPFTALDQLGIQDQQKELAKFIHQGGTVVLTSHQDLTLPTIQVLPLDHYTSTCVERQ